MKEKEIIELKSKILFYIKNKKEFYLSDIIEEFGVEPEILIKILNELKKEKVIRELTNERA